MNYLVSLDPSTGELEKILSGFTCMTVKEIDTAEPMQLSIRPGDSLYFLRDKDYIMQVKATVVRVLTCINSPDKELQGTLKELQPKLQLTEEQYNYWSVKQQVILVEFCSAQKINPVHIEETKMLDRSKWIPFEEPCLYK
jgi:hypothetical protein